MAAQCCGARGPSFRRRPVMRDDGETRKLGVPRGGDSVCFRGSILLDLRPLDSGLNLCDSPKGANEERYGRLPVEIWDLLSGGPAAERV
jgi:hypothetical protein